MNLSRNLKNLVFQIYTYNVFREIKEYSKRYSKVVVFFPSVDTMGILLSKKLLLKALPNVSIRLRTFSGESRGPFATGNELLDLAKSVKVVNPVDFKIGFEVEPYEEILVESGFAPEVIFWVPIPSNVNHTPTKFKSRDGVSLGFLGGAKERKGFENIPELLGSLIGGRIRFNSYIQEAPFPWPEYAKALKALDLLDAKIQFIDSKLSAEELELAILRCDLLVLPYDPGSYRLAGSGLLFQAADLGVPVLTTKGTGFSTEIVAYGIGGTYEGKEEFNAFIRTFNPDSFREKLNAYNKVRNSSSYEFLKLGKS